jgi:hypothetical protein
MVRAVFCYKKRGLNAILKIRFLRLFGKAHPWPRRRISGMPRNAKSLALQAEKLAVKAEPLHPAFSL